MNPKRRLSKREKILATVIFVVILAAVLYATILEDIFGQWDRLTLEIRSKERLLQRNMNLISEADGINSAFARMSELFDAAQSESATPSTVLKHIQILARGEIELENIKPLETKTLETSILHEFELEGKAEKTKLIRFLHKVALSEEALMIRSLTLNSTREGETLKYHMVISKMLLR